MQTSDLVLVIILLALVGYRLGRARAIRVVGGSRLVRRLHSLPAYYGILTALWCAIPALLVIAGWQLLGDRILTDAVLREIPGHVHGLTSADRDLLGTEIENAVAGDATRNRGEIMAAVSRYQVLQRQANTAVSVACIVVALLGGVIVWRRIKPQLQARNAVEYAITAVLLMCACVAIATTIGIVLSVLFEALRFFERIPLAEFLFGLHWNPQVSSAASGSESFFGAVPLFVGTLLVALIAMMVAVPVGLFSAIYLAEYASSGFRSVSKPVLETLAGIPTVVYGFFAVLTLGPLLRDLGQSAGLAISTESALSAGLVMGVMIIPYVSSLADDMLRAVPQSLRDGSVALGATQSETIRRVVFPAAMPGIVGGILLGVSRAIGETMIVVMAAGLSANLTINPLHAVTTVTVQIVTLLAGDQELESPVTLAAFALGLSLFVITLLLNVVALQVVRRYREQYE